MKFNKSVICFIILSIVTFLHANNNIKYVNFKTKEILNTKDKNFEYYSFNDVSQFEAELTGAGRFKLFLRADKSTKINITLDDEKIGEVNIEEKFSQSYKFDKNENKLTKATVFTFKIPAGQHNLILKPTSGTGYVRIEKLKSQKWIQYSPKSYNSEVQIKSNGKNYSYYESTKENPVIFKLKIKSDIRILSRAMLPKNIENQMFNYSYIIDINGKKQSVNVKSVASGFAMNDNNPVTKACEKILKSVKDNAEIKIYPESDEKLYFQMQIPQKGLKNK